jgi:hypothetical protein
LRDLARLDQALYEAVTVTSTPTLDSALRRLSAAADHSKVSLLIAATLALRPGRSRRAAVLGAVGYSRVHTGVHHPGDVIAAGGAVMRRV